MRVLALHPFVERKGEELLIKEILNPVSYILKPKPLHKYCASALFKKGPRRVEGTFGFPFLSSQEELVKRSNKHHDLDGDTLGF